MLLLPYSDRHYLNVCRLALFIHLPVKPHL